jgi:hypothetical protein
MTNNSSTGGYLIPASQPAPLQDSALIIFFQALTVGILGFTDPTLVRPRWQPVMPTQPSITTDWAVLGIVNRKGDTFAFVGHNLPYPEADIGTGQGYDLLQRHEELDILFSIYGPNADDNAALLRDGLSAPQNRETFQLNGMGLIEVGEARTVPPMLNEQQYYKVDMMVRIRRSISRVYPVLDVLSSAGTVGNEYTTDEFNAE